MPVDHLGAGDEHRRPTMLPGAKAEVEILYIGRLVDLEETAERSELGSIYQ
ncbi:hypothetical protein D3C83_249590 [compost metagenome]